MNLFMPIVHYVSIHKMGKRIRVALATGAELGQGKALLAAAAA